MMTKLKDLINEAYNWDEFEDARPGVKEEIENFFDLPEEEREDTVLLYWLLGSGTPAYKMSKEQSNYVDETPHEGHNCGNCEYLYKSNKGDHFICSQISGKVKLEGWCKLWDGVENPQFEV